MFLLFFSLQLFASQLIDHKGANNPFDWKSEGCAAQKIFELKYPYVDNTLEAIETSFQQGADSVEIDLRMTSDDQIVLFQEEVVDCLTNGKGRVREKTLKELKLLDFGYGIYLEDGTFPLRGKGIGKIVTLREVLQRFPSKNFMLNPKEKDRKTARLMAQVLNSFKGRDYSQFSFWGSPMVYHELKSQTPSFGVLVANHHQSYLCWESWKKIGFTGLWPEVCRKQKSLSLNLDEWSIDWWHFPFPFLYQARKNGLDVWLFNTSDPHRIRGLLIHSAGIIASDLSSMPLGEGAGLGRP